MCEKTESARRAYALKTPALLSLFLFLSVHLARVFAVYSVLAFFLFPLRYSLSRPPPAPLACRRRFLGVSVAGNRRNRFFCSSNHRATSPSLSISPFPSFISLFFSFFSLLLHSTRRQSAVVLGGKRVTIG